MANTPARYTQADVTRALKGALAAGVKVREAYCTPDGVRLIFADNDDGANPANPWDAVHNEAS